MLEAGARKLLESRFCKAPIIDQRLWQTRTEGRVRAGLIGCLHVLSDQNQWQVNDLAFYICWCLDLR